MAKKTDDAPEGSDSIIAALNDIYRPVLTAFEQFHRQEHRFGQKYRYEKLETRFDNLVGLARCWRRKLLNRIERLGGEADSVIEKVVVVDDVKGAYEATQKLMDVIYDAVNKAIAQTVVEEDHPTHKLLLKLQTKVDHERSKVAAWLRQVDDLGESYLLTVLNG